MNRINSIFEHLKAEGKTALMPFLTVGYPSLGVTRQVIPTLKEAGASILEIGFPFSDPIADGPVIAGSMHDALMAGVTPPENIHHDFGHPIRNYARSRGHGQPVDCFSGGQ